MRVDKRWAFLLSFRILPAVHDIGQSVIRRETYATKSPKEADEGVEPQARWRMVEVHGGDA